jgi:hypothetical protein
MAFHEKAGRSQVNSFVFLLDKLFFSGRVATAVMLPFALSRSDSFRSVQFGRSRFSRCCHLIGALWFCSFESRTWASFALVNLYLHRKRLAVARA